MGVQTGEARKYEYPVVFEIPYEREQKSFDQVNPGQRNYESKKREVRGTNFQLK